MICKTKERAIITLDLWSQKGSNFTLNKELKNPYKNALTQTY
jgi:hypothetical protein